MSRGLAPPYDLDGAVTVVPERRSGGAGGGGGSLARVGGAALLRHAVYKRTLAAIDLVAGAAAVTLAGVAVGHGQVMVGALLTLPLIVLTAHLSGLYNRDEVLLHRTTLEEAPAMFQVAALYALLTWLLCDATLGGKLHPSQVVAIWGLLFGFMLLGRALGRWAVRQITPAERCLVLGDAGSAAAIQRKLALSFSLKAAVVGRISFDDERESGRGGMSPPVLGGVAELDDVLIQHEVDRVIVVPNGSGDSLEAIRAAKTLGVPVSVLPRMLEAIGSSFELDDVDGLTLLGIRSSQLTRSAWVLKRSMDLTLGSLGLVALAPVFVAIALAIKLTSPGPVLYRQRRIGRDGLEFEMFKFRSMVDGADAQKAHLLELNETQGLFKIADDPRTTPVGRFLRSSSLDELPQVWNVVRGDMSLVGPRPLVPDDDAKIEGWRRKRLNIKPGITGPWQILGSTRSPLEEMVKLDYLYGATWSLWLDAKIMLRTLIYMVSRRSA